MKKLPRFVPINYDLYRPDIPEAERRKRLRGWHKAVRCAYNWARDDDEEA